MPNPRESEDRLRIDVLRQISYLAEYIDRSNYLSQISIAGLVAVVLGGALYFSHTLNFTMSIVMVYCGLTLFAYTFWQRRRFKTAFLEASERIFERTLARSSDYEKVVRDLRDRTNELVVELAEREHELMTREKSLRDLETEISRLRAKRDREEAEFSKSSRKR